MSLRISPALGAVLFSALFAVNCSPPLIRCETDNECTSDMKCDVRQGLCVDKGEYIENPDGTPAAGIDTVSTASAPTNSNGQGNAR
ncbi:hypothetical protein [Hyalangium versicolor]|uniref:hypothetical protein n=1 Tax=Hyalangium versicolor TaxID=2861190 RepID=UPI001CC9B3B4|nr:hypothetical protein [Hyalangium versicolor]